LLDEVGTGTDPEEGSALGVAIVDHFRRECGSQVMASTHYRGLKIYAANDPGIINASVEFNEKTLQPTYKLLIGLAGASSGIEIARRFGILPEVIGEARENLDVSAQEAENYLRRLQDETKQATDLRIALEEEREATALKYASLEIEAIKKEKERQRQFEKELAQTIEEFDRQSKAFIEGIEDKALKTRLDKERQTRKAELNRAVIAKVQGGGGRFQVPSPKPQDVSSAAVSVGAHVVTSFGNIGVVERMDKEVAEVLVGGMRLREKIKNLQVVAEGAAGAGGKLEKLQKDSKASNLRLDVEDMNAELNLIGQTTADAEYEIDRFLDEAYLNSLQRVRIIHGFGTGALKNFVHHFLKGHPHIAKFGFAPQDQGGQGATIAELKQ
jgi:DNA mismatch repair protein MutS2